MSLKLTLHPAQCQALTGLLQRAIEPLEQASQILPQDSPVGPSLALQLGQFIELREYLSSRLTQFYLNEPKTPEARRKAAARGLGLSYLEEDGK